MKGKKQQKSDEYLTYRIVLAFLGAAICLLLTTKLQVAIDTPTTHAEALTISLIIAVVCGVLMLFSFGIYIRSVRNESYRSGKVINGLFVAAASFIMGFSALLLWLNHIVGMKVIYVMVPAAALLFLVYSVYPKTMFITLSSHIYVFFCFYLLFKYGDIEYRLFSLISGLFVCALAVLLFFATKKNGGCIKLFGVNLLLFDKETSQRNILLLYVITAAALIGAFFGPSFLSFGAVIVTIVFIIGSLVYGTVQLIH